MPEPSRGRGAAPRFAGLPLLWLGLVLALAGCAASQPEILPGPLPPGATWSGRWVSNYGIMELRQMGSSVEGTVEHNDGRIRGVAEGDLLRFDWEQPTHMAEARLGVRGKGWFRFAPDGQTFEGRWGYEDRREGGGAWRGERSRL